MQIHRKNFDSINRSKKYVRGLALSLCVFLGLSVATDNISQNNYNCMIINKIDEDPSDLLQELELFAGVETNNNPNLVVLHAILNNKNLDDEEKEYFYKLADLISENPYLETKLSYETLLNLDIIYLGEKNKYDETVLAIYSENENVIKVFEDKDNFNKEIFLHELIHALFTNKKTISLPKFILEGTTELLTNEYLSNSPFVEQNTYPFEIATVKLLCEMVGAEEILKTYTTGDIDSLYEKLDENSNLNSRRFIENVDAVFTALSNKEEIPADKYNEMIVYLDNYFSQNYSDNIEKLELYEYYKGILNIIYSDNPYYEYEKYIQEKGIILKPYYSSKLKEQYPVLETAMLDNSYGYSYQKSL